MATKSIYTKVSSLIIFSFLIGCGTSGANKNSVPIVNQGKNTKEVKEAIISFYEVYRLPDTTVQKIAESISEIRGATSIYFYDEEPQNLVGMTDFQKNKKRVTDIISKLNPLPGNTFFCWSNLKVKNKITKEEFYHLFWLKKTEPELKIQNQELSKAEVVVDETTNEIVITLNESGVNKRNRMIENANNNNNFHIAAVIDSLAYACSNVKSKIHNEAIRIAGFETKAEAENIVSRIKAMNNQN